MRATKTGGGTRAELTFSPPVRNGEGGTFHGWQLDAEGAMERKPLQGDDRGYTSGSATGYSRNLLPSTIPTLKSFRALTGSRLYPGHCTRRKNADVEFDVRFPNGPRCGAKLDARRPGVQLGISGLPTVEQGLSSAALKVSYFNGVLL
jgi:hypothetical protein